MSIREIPSGLFKVVTQEKVINQESIERSFHKIAPRLQKDTEEVKISTGRGVIYIFDAKGSFLRTEKEQLTTLVVRHASFTKTTKEPFITPEAIEKYKQKFVDAAKRQGMKYVKFEAEEPIIIEVDDSELALKMPSLYKQFKNLTLEAGKTLKNIAAGAAPNVSQEERERRLSICKGCEKYDTERARCSLCGCLMKFKTYLASATCPHPDGDKWGQQSEN